MNTRKNNVKKTCRISPYKIVTPIRTFIKKSIAVKHDKDTLRQVYGVNYREFDSFEFLSDSNGSISGINFNGNKGGTIYTGPMEIHYQHLNYESIKI